MDKATRDMLTRMNQRLRETAKKSQQVQAVNLYGTHIPQSKWYNDPIDDEDTVEMLITPAEARDIFGDAVSYPNECRHEWKKYTGAREVFDFCIKCDTKR